MHLLWALCRHVEDRPFRVRRVRNRREDIAVREHRAFRVAGSAARVAEHREVGGLRRRHRAKEGEVGRAELLSALAFCGSLRAARRVGAWPDCGCVLHLGAVDWATETVVRCVSHDAPPLSHYAQRRSRTCLDAEGTIARDERGNAYTCAALAASSARSCAAAASIRARSCAAAAHWMAQLTCTLPAEPRHPQPVASSGCS